MAMLLGAVDLPGEGWEVVEERTWPTGQLDPTSEKSRRALDAGGITAWRSLAQSGPKRSAWVEVVPYATAADARLSLRQVPHFFVGVAGAEETITGERAVDDQYLPGVADTWFYKKSTTGPAGEVCARYVGGTVGEVLFLTCMSDREPWPWEDVVGVAGLQADRVRRSLVPTDEG
jgi:hypothetical protein